MLKCISKPDTQYAELLVNAGQGGKYDPSAPKKANLESGLYELHLYIQQTRGLINAADAGESLNPVIQVHAFEQKRHSKTKKNTGTGMTYWGEHIYFIKKFGNESELETQKLKLEVFDDKLIGSDALVGDFELDIMSIYHSDNHCILHKWLALSNFDKGLNEVKGYVLISANVITSGDEAFELNDYQPSEGSGSEPKVLMPPHLETKPWQMKISLIRAENLVKMDLLGSIDCYLLFQYAGATFKTDVVKDNRNPIWGKHIFIPFSEPATDDWLTIKIYDHDQMQSDELVGVCSLKKEEILEGRYQEYLWLNIYGSQPDGDRENCNRMNQFPALGSMWKGRVLLSAVVYENDKPKLGSENIDANIMSKYSAKNTNKEWTMIAEVLYGEGYPDRKEKYSIEFRWANLEIPFSSVSAPRGVWEWYERKKLTCTFPYIHIEMLPDIFIYLKQGDKRLCFIRKKAADVLDKYNQEPQLFFFKISNDKYPDLTDDKAGYIKMRILVGSKESLQNSSFGGGWTNPLIRPLFSESLLYIHVYNAKNLIPADDEGVSDPFILANFNGVQIKSEILKTTINPVWNTTLLMKVPISTLKDAPPLFVKMYDWDEFSEDDLIGTCYINLSQALQEKSLLMNSNEIPTPKWYPLHFSTDLEGGKMLLGFNLFLGNASPRLLPSLLPPFEKFNVKIKALGVRGLQKVGIHPIKKPFVVFNVDSIRDPQSKVSLPEKNLLIAEAKTYGPNANFSTIVNFSIDLPKDPLLWPNLNCLVKNCVWKNKIEPLLGTFAIDLSEAGEKTRNKITQKITKLATKMPSKVLDIPLKKDISKNIKTLNPNQSNSKIIDIEMPQNVNKKQSKNIFSSQNQKYVEFVDELEENSKIKSPFLSNEKLIKTVNLDAENKESNNIPMPLMPMPSNISENLEIDPIIIKAIYEKDANSPYAKEKNIPDPKKYYPLGYDLPKNRLDPTLSKKHYRLFLESTLESSKFMDHHIFDEYIITRGNKAAQNSSGISKLLGIDESPKALGIFKCLIEVLNEKDKNALENSRGKPLMELFDNKSQKSDSVVRKSKNLPKKLDLDKEFMQSNNVVVRVHILEVFNLVQLESDSIPNPYISVRLGDQVKTNEKEYQKEVTAAEFYSTFELNTILPGNCLLQIQVMDHHDLSSDVVIGETLIDLENRWFSKKWRKLKDKPIETRDIYSPICSIPTGRVRVFVEIIPDSDKAALKNCLSITPKKPEEFELRCVVWEIDGCPQTDFTDTSDYFVTGSVGDNTQKTDIHWQAKNGYGSFNWRMVFPIMLPTPNATMTFQVWDKDLIGSDDYISAVTMDFSSEAKDAFENDTSVKIYGKESLNIMNKISGLISSIKSDKENKEKENEQKKKETQMKEGEKFDLNLMNVAKDGYNLKNEGKIKISFELVPPKMAKANPVGKGRSEPNASPFCPEPKGRLQLSLNPFTMIEQFFGPKMKMKICLTLCLGICCVLTIAMIPMIISNLSADFLTSWL